MEIGPEEQRLKFKINEMSRKRNNNGGNILCRGFIFWVKNFSSMGSERLIFTFYV